jgi:cytosine/adenosine deaminase-related metal-dependent hydrolase
MSSLSLVGGTVLTMGAERRIWRDATVVVENGRIAAVGSATVAGGRTVDCRGKLVLPGLVNAHAHTLEVLFRGCGGELRLLPWIHERSHPLLDQLDEQGAAVAIRLAALEMLRSGTTAFLDPEVPLRLLAAMTAASADTGLRAGLALAVEGEAGYGGHGHGGDAQGGHGHDPHGQYGHGQDGHGHAHGSATALSTEERAALDGWRDPTGGRLALWLGPRVLSAVTPGLGHAIRQEAETRGLGVTFHCAEVPEDVAHIRTTAATTTVDFAAGLGLLGPRSVLVHGVYLEEGELAPLAATGASVAHCPSSNAKLGSGVAPVPTMRGYGLNVALGTDGGLCNDTYDLLAEMRLAGLIHKAIARDPAAITPETVVELATTGGARALGLAEAGALEAGCWADVVVVDLRRAGSWPTPNPVDSLVFSADRAVVDTVLVAGQVLLQDGQPVGVDQRRLLAEAEEVARQAVQEAGLSGAVAPRWPVATALPAR